MLNPSPMQLLTGLADALAADVGPALPSGPAAEQLTGAVAMLRRIARSLEDFPAYLLEDLAELSAALQTPAPPFNPPSNPPSMADESMADPLLSRSDSPPSGASGGSGVSGLSDAEVLAALPATLPGLGTLIAWDLQLRAALADRCRAAPAEQGALLDLLRSLNRREATLRLSPWER